jgi:hypothetical protein
LASEDAQALKTEDNPDFDKVRKVFAKHSFVHIMCHFSEETSLWSYGFWIYNYLCNQCLSPLMLWVRTPFMARWGVFDTTFSDKFSQWLATGRWFSLGTPVSSINKIEPHDITEILLKVALNTINLILNPYSVPLFSY